MIKKYFEFEKLGTNFKTEIIAGLTTFTTMSYLLIVVPFMLSNVGAPFNSVFFGVVLVSAFASIFNGLYSKRPFGLAPYLGECAFVCYTVIGVLGYSLQESLAAIFICGILLFVLTILKIRPWLVNSIPQSLKLSFTAGLGLFLILAGLKETGIIQITNNTLTLGDISNIHTVLAIICCLMMIVLTSLKIKSAILFSIIFMTILGLVIGDVKLPQNLLSFDVPTLSSTFMNFEFKRLFTSGGFILIFTFFVLIFTDTMGSLIGISYKANLLDEKGNLPEIKKPMLIDSISTIIGAILGTTTVGYCAESLTGIESGGKSGFTSIVIGILFLISFVFAPLIGIIPIYAYSPALILIGILMSTSLSSINYDDYTEYLPSVVMIFLIVFTSNFGVGMSAGFILYPILKLINKRHKETSLGVWILFVMSIIFFILYNRI